GEFLRNLTPSAAIMSAGLFHPFGLVFGPDGHLYVSNWPELGHGGSGNILSFDAQKRAFLGVFASNVPRSDTDSRNCFTGPEGLVFGPDGYLYTTSRPADPSDTDKIVIFAGPGKPDAGAFRMTIPLDVPSEKRNIPRALLFGPHGLLYVPIYHP